MAEELMTERSTVTGWPWEDIDVLLPTGPDVPTSWRVQQFRLVCVDGQWTGSLDIVPTPPAASCGATATEGDQTDHG